MQGFGSSKAAGRSHIVGRSRSCSYECCRVLARLGACPGENHPAVGEVPLKRQKALMS